MRAVTVTAADRTLFHVAARELGDPLQAVRIAQVNHMSDTQIVGVRTLLIPEKGPNTGGLPAPGTIVP